MFNFTIFVNLPIIFEKTGTIRDKRLNFGTNIAFLKKIPGHKMEIPDCPGQTGMYGQFITTNSYEDKPVT